MKYEISHEQLQKSVAAIELLSKTNLYTPLEYSNVVVPFINELQSLPALKEERFDDKLNDSIDKGSTDTSVI